MNAKVCKQCGELKPIEQFRKYYGGRKGNYNTCKVCEKINAREKYLRRKGDLMSTAESEELDKIYKLYSMQRTLGLQPPTRAERNKPIVDSLDDMIAKYQDMTVMVSVDAGADKGPIPGDLHLWLQCELHEEPDYYLDDVYEELKAKYRPQLSIDTVTMQPIYDDTYKETLDQILERFYDYEEKYWED